MCPPAGRTIPAPRWTGAQIRSFASPAGLAVVVAGRPAVRGHVAGSDERCLEVEVTGGDLSGLPTDDRDGLDVLVVLLRRPCPQVVAGINSAVIPARDGGQCLVVIEGPFVPVSQSWREADRAVVGRSGRYRARDDARWVPTTVLDVSTIGASILSPRRLAGGSDLEVELPVADPTSRPASGSGQAAVRCAAKVTRSVPTGDGRFLTGIGLRGVDLDDTRTLDRYVTRRRVDHDPNARRWYARPVASDLRGDGPG